MPCCLSALPLPCQSPARARGNRQRAGKGGKKNKNKRSALDTKGRVGSRRSRRGKRPRCCSVTRVALAASPAALPVHDHRLSHFPRQNRGLSPPAVTTDYLGRRTAREPRAARPTAHRPRAAAHRGGPDYGIASARNNQEDEMSRRKRGQAESQGAQDVLGSLTAGQRVLNIATFFAHRRRTTHARTVRPHPFRPCDPCNLQP
jgi:hypothetical protein